ncbi:extracellular solute-binding protein [Coralliovum pocilloporae]|uniref:extracellular solute-binding protein n=1 Tax=Coralliovum pocilloporae TaxID=3066369 RepID=UPI0033074EE6
MTVSDLSRRTLLKGGAALATLSGLHLPARAAGEQHGLSVFGDLKYPADFKYFDYVNPEAPKGGSLSMTAPNWQYNQNAQTFNTLNSYIFRGDAPPRMELTFDTLMVRAFDEPDALYGLVAKSVSVSDDGNIYRFHLRPEARFRDGSLLTADDAAFTINLLKEQGHPQIRDPIRELVSAEAEAEHVLRLTFSGRQSRQVPLIVASALPVFSKAYYSEHAFDDANLMVPLGSGPYRVGAFKPGDFITYERDETYWARDLPVNRGQNNFDTIRIEFYRDSTVSFEAFKTGSLTFREEFFSKLWATSYDFPAMKDGRVKRVTFSDKTPAGAQGWFLNTRREKFADVRTREALGLTFDFEWSNRKLFYGLYTRTASFFENSILKAAGKPGAEERALLEPYRGQVPDSVFADAFEPPVSSGTGKDRNLLRRAAKLLNEAGWRRQGGRLVNARGEPFTMEILGNSPAFERIIGPWVQNLKALGIEGSFRLVDPSQYQARLNSFDFDAVGRRYSFPPTPGEQVRLYWGSEAARTEGSFNLAGIADPVVDALMEKMFAADNRKDLVVAARALDRVLRSGHYWVPNWYKASHTTALWDMYGWPDPLPDFAFPVERLFWYDKEKAEALNKKGS